MGGRRRFLSGLGCVPLAGCASVVLDRAPPQTPRQPAVKVPRLAQHELPGGSQLYLAPDPGLPLVAIAVAMRGGYRDDPPGKEGLATTIAGALASRRTDADRGDALDPYGELGTTVSGFARSSLLFWQCTVHRDDAASALQLMASRPSLEMPDPRFEVARRGRIEALDLVRGTPEEIAALGLVLASDGVDSPSLVTGLGSAATLAALNPDDSRAWLSARERTDTLAVALAGDVDERTARAWITTAFDGWPTPGEPPMAPRPVVHRPARGPQVVLVPWPRLPQAILAFGSTHPAYGHPDEPAHTVAAWIVGSLMHRELRARQRTSYGMQWDMLDTRDGHVLSQWAKLEPVDIGRAVQRLRTRLLALQNDIDLSEAALRSATRNERVGVMDSLHGAETALHELVRLMDERLPAGLPERRARAFADLGAPQVLHTIRTAYHPDLVRICIVGDEDTLDHARRVLPAREIVERGPEQLLGMHGRA